MLGLVSANPILLLISIFIYFGASAEAADTELRRLARTLTVSDVTRSNVRPIASGASISDAITLMLQAGQHAIPVIHPDGSLAGIATKDRITRAVHRSGRAAPVTEALEPNLITVPSHEKLADALNQMQSQSAPAIIVIGGQGEIAGLLTSDTLADLMVMETAAEKPNSGARSAGAALTVSVPKSA